MINCYLLEEHNEAFFTWVNAYKEGLIRKNSLLLHFDDHSDFRVPTFIDSVSDIFKWDKTAIYNFTYNQVNIDTFIAPCIYLNIIKDFIWIRHEMPLQNKKEMRMRSFNGLGKKLIMEDAASHNETGDSQLFSYTRIPADRFYETAMDSGQETIILDIDLDYFSCCENPFIENEILIEITEQEYNEFIQNKKYHYLNYITANVTAKKHNDSFFYILNHIPEIYPSRRKVSEKIILERIDQLVFNLKNKKINPSIITLCRSRNSGFTPADQWKFIEDNLLFKLSSLYPIAVKHIENQAIAKSYETA